MNKGQVPSAMGKIIDAFKLFNEAHKMLRQNNVSICGLSLKGEFMCEYDEVQLYEGIDNLAKILGKGLAEDECRRNVYFVVGKTKFFECVQGDGSHR